MTAIGVPMSIGWSEPDGGLRILTVKCASRSTDQLHKAHQTLRPSRKSRPWHCGSRSARARCDGSQPTWGH